LFSEPGFKYISGTGFSIFNGKPRKFDEQGFDIMEAPTGAVTLINIERDEK
jgi:hypothetical protein